MSSVAVGLDFRKNFGESFGKRRKRRVYPMGPSLSGWRSGAGSRGTPKKNSENLNLIRFSYMLLSLITSHYSHYCSADSQDGRTNDTGPSKNRNSDTAEEIANINTSDSPDY